MKIKNLNHLKKNVNLINLEMNMAWKMIDSPINKGWLEIKNVVGANIMIIKIVLIVKFEKIIF